MTNETKEPRRRNRAAWVVVSVLVAVFVLYALSIGPAYALRHHTNIHWTWVHEFYWPVTIAAKKLGCGQLLTRYVEWWLHLSGNELPSVL